MNKITVKIIWLTDTAKLVPVTRNRGSSPKSSCLWTITSLFLHDLASYQKIAI